MRTWALGAVNNLLVNCSKMANIIVLYIFYIIESDADSSDTLKLENEKLRTQVESLKAIAEQNPSLMWSMQNYQYQAEKIKQQYSNLVAQKDYEVQHI